MPARTSSTTSTRSISVYDRLRIRVEREALEAARNVAWPRLAAAVAVATEWEVRSLWLRAVGNAAGEIPPAVTAELPALVPESPKVLAGQLAKLPIGQNAGDLAWGLTCSWVERNVLREAADGGWLAAVRYYSARTIAYMQAWSHWDKVDAKWSTSPPSVWPSLSAWREAVLAVRTLSNPRSSAQNVLAARHSLTEAEWSQLLSQFRTIMAFCLWLEITFAVRSETALAELSVRFPEFPSRLRSGPPASIVRKFHRWAAQRLFNSNHHEATLVALAWHVRYCPEYGALSRYAAHCRRLWLADRMDITGFDGWRKEAQTYVERAS